MMFIKQQIVQYILLPKYISTKGNFKLCIFSLDALEGQNHEEAIFNLISNNQLQTSSPPLQKKKKSQLFGFKVKKKVAGNFKFPNK